MSDQPADGDETPPPRRVGPRAFESLVDQQIRAAEAAGLFRNLPGAGKPLNLRDDDDVPEELRAGFRMLKSAGYAPPWIELQKSIREEQAELEAWLARVNRRWHGCGAIERARLRAEFEQKLRDLNTQMTTYNLMAPPAAGQFPLLQPWRELRKLGE
ncbi:MAG: hypothetical protein OHK0015_12200 [Chloroflexi bacterium OHK40]